MLAVLCKDEDSSSAYIDALVPSGHDVTFLPVLCFALRHAVAEEALELIGPLPIIAITSQRAARVLCDVLHANEHLSRRVRAGRVYSLGFATGSMLIDGGLAPRGSSCKTSEELADLIASDMLQPSPHDQRSSAVGGIKSTLGDSGEAKRVLFFCGSKRLDTLPQALHEAGISVSEAIVYDVEAATGSDIDSAWSRALVQVRRKVIVVFFSPSGVHAVMGSDVAGRALRDAQVAGIQETSITCVALGATTAAAMRDEGLQVAAVADTPSPAGLVDALGRLHL